MSANGGIGNSKSPSLYKSSKETKKLRKLSESTFSKLWNQIKSLEPPGECLMKKKQLKFGQRALHHFNLLRYHSPLPAQLTALKGNSPHSWYGLQVPEGAIWTFSQRTVVGFVLCFFFFPLTCLVARLYFLTQKLSNVWIGGECVWVVCLCVGVDSVGGVYWKYLKANVLAAAIVGANWNSLEGRVRKEMLWGILECLGNSCISRELQGHTHVKLSACPKRSEEVRSSHPWLTFMFHISRKWRLKKSSYKLPGWMLKVYLTCAQSLPAKPGKGGRWWWHSRHLKMYL